jgi:bifunctional non-homologous end joining protein LigD
MSTCRPSGPFRSGYRLSSRSLFKKPRRARQWLHEIKLDGFRMAVRIERGKTKLLTRTGLDWSAKYPSLLSAVAAVRAGNAYLDGELCGVGEDGLPNFAQTQAATDGARGVRLVFCAFGEAATVNAWPLSSPPIHQRGRDVR